MKKIDLFKEAITISKNEQSNIKAGDGSYHDDTGDSMHNDSGDSYHNDFGDSIHTDFGGSSTHTDNGYPGPGQPIYGPRPFVIS